MVQRYTFMHKINGNENVSVLNFIKSNNLKVDGCKNSVRTASLPNFLLPKLKKMVTETLHFQIIFVTLRQKLKL